MNTARVRSAYQQSEAQSQIHPVKLIHLMFERVLVHLDLVEEGVLKNDAKLRGENLSKVIAIITELNVSIKEGDDSEAAEFLRGLYASILLELPKVAVNQDVEIVRKSASYMRRLKEIWEQTALVEAGLVDEKENGKSENKAVPEKEETPPQVEPEVKSAPGPKSYGAKTVASVMTPGVSVSI